MELMVLVGWGEGSSVGSVHQYRHVKHVVAEQSKKYSTGNIKSELTAANFIRVVCAVHVVVTLLVFANALTVVTGELIPRALNCSRVETHSCW